MANAHTYWIVVWDPKGEYWEGSIVEPARNNQLVQRGVVTLPVVPEIFKLSGVGGYHRRSWGAGVPLDSTSPRIVCPLTMYCTKDLRAIYWCARLVTTPENIVKVQGGEHFEGLIRISGDSGQPTGFQSGMVHEEMCTNVNSLGAPDALGGWNIKGKSLLYAPTDGHYGFGLYGMAPGLRVAWNAISLAQQ